MLGHSNIWCFVILKTTSTKIKLISSEMTIQIQTARPRIR